MEPTRAEHYHEQSYSEVWFFLGVSVLAILAFLLLYYGIPTPKIPQAQQAPQIEIPGRIDVNLNQPQ